MPETYSAGTAINCPFCGSRSAKPHFIKATYWQVKCEHTNCHAAGPQALNPEGAINFWNGRPAVNDREPLLAQIQGMEEALESAAIIVGKFDEAMASQQPNTPDAKLMVMANYGDLALQHLRTMLALSASGER